MFRIFLVISLLFITKSGFGQSQVTKQEFINTIIKGNKEFEITENQRLEKCLPGMVCWYAFNSNSDYYKKDTIVFYSNLYPFYSIEALINLEIQAGPLPGRLQDLNSYRVWSFDKDVNGILVYDIIGGEIFVKKVKFLNKQIGRVFSKSLKFYKNDDEVVFKLKDSGGESEKFKVIGIDKIVTQTGEYKYNREVKRISLIRII